MAVLPSSGIQADPNLEGKLNKQINGLYDPLDTLQPYCTLHFFKLAWCCPNCKICEKVQIKGSCYYCYCGTPAYRNVPVCIRVRFQNPTQLSETADMGKHLPPFLKETGNISFKHFRREAFPTFKHFHRKARSDFFTLGLSLSPAETVDIGLQPLLGSEDLPERTCTHIRR